MPGLAISLSGAHFVLMGLSEVGGVSTWQDISGAEQVREVTHEAGVRQQL